MRRYSVQTVREGTARFYYILNQDTMEMELLPSRYLMHKIKSNRSPNTVKRTAMSLCYYLEYLAEKQTGFTAVSYTHLDVYKRQTVLMKRRRSWLSS